MIKDVTNFSAPSASTRKKGRKTLPKISGGSVHAQMVRCGRPGCKCSRGELHGPYYYHFYRDEGKLKKRYLKLSEVAAFVADLKAHREERTRLQATVQAGRARAGRISELLRELQKFEGDTEQWLDKKVQSIYGQSLRRLRRAGLL